MPGVNHFSIKGRTSPAKLKRVICYNYGLNGHMAKGCRRPKNFRGGKSVALVRVSGKRIPTCYNRGLKGHIAKECRRRNFIEKESY
jgi:hypothetical protein